MATRRESFIPDRSQHFNLATGAENRTDLTLAPNPAVDYGSITGFVMTGTTPVENAMVKVLTLQSEPLDHQFTNEAGRFATSPLPAGNYQVVASAPGFLTSEPGTVNLMAARDFLINFSLTPDPRAAKNALFGLILNQLTGTRIADASVILMDAQGQTVATTQTNSDGEYLLDEIDNGSYQLTAEKPEFQLPAPLMVTVSGSQIAKTDINLTPDTAVEGTVHGFIKDPNGNPLTGACVCLYSAADPTEMPLQTIFTNSSGLYLFGNVPAGEYYIKGKLDIAN